MNTRPKSRVPVDIVLLIDRRIDGKFVRSIGPTCLYAAARLETATILIPHEHRELLKAHDAEKIIVAALKRSQTDRSFGGSRFDDHCFTFDEPLQLVICRIGEVRCQQTQDTGTHWGVVCTRSMAASNCAIVSSISLFTMVRSKKWPYACFSESDSFASLARLPSHCNIR